MDANRYIVPHTLVGEKLTIRLKDGHLRIFDGAELVEEYDAPEGKGHLVGLDRGHYERLRADRQMQQRKFGQGGRRKGNVKGRARIKDGSQAMHPRSALKRTISPVVPRYPVVVEPIAVLDAFTPQIVEHRSMDVYARLGGEVRHG
ncbi:MAG: hypothetical protein KGL39_58245 [Patescibacteria group bacterium]|nr:hypothetical protein [Patescibacteria group bacterium]